MAINHFPDQSEQTSRVGEQQRVEIQLAFARIVQAMFPNVKGYRGHEIRTIPLDQPLDGIPTDVVAELEQKRSESQTLANAEN